MVMVATYYNYSHINGVRVRKLVNGTNKPACGGGRRTEMGSLDPARVRLGRIRCLTEAIECLRKGENLPKALCYVPKSLTYEFCEVKESVPILEEPKVDAKMVDKLPEGKTCKVIGKGQPLFNKSGVWVRTSSPQEGWLLIQPINKSLKATVKIVSGTPPSSSATSGSSKKQSDKKEASNWLKVVEQMCTLNFGKQPQLTNMDQDEMDKLIIPPPGWNLDADEELAQFLIQHQFSSGLVDGMNVAQGSEHFLRVQASSEEDQLQDMLNPDTEDHYWESDGNQGDHWLRFHMKPGTIVQKFGILVDPDDGSYLPRRVIVKGGTRSGNMNTLSSRNFTSMDYDNKVLQLLLNPLTTFYEIIEVHMKSCHQGGIDCRIRGVIVTTQAAQSIFLPSEDLTKDVFTTERIARCPKLQPFQPDQLFYRALVLKRIAHLLNVDLTYLLPRYPHTCCTKVDAIYVIRQLWPLSSQRNGLIQHILSETSCSSPSRPTLYINRLAARQHSEDPSKDLECKKAIFNQIISELKKHAKPSTYNFRWAGHWSQWWECKFSQEGMIDQGGGFRDSLADVGEELCPSDPDHEVSLTLFIGSPNQTQDSSNVYRDTYIPNPGCQLKSKYFFLGQLMGAMFRSQESLVLSLAPFTWKKLVGEQVTWSRDFMSVDSAEVKFIDSVETMSREKFEGSFKGMLKFTTVLSNGETISLVPDGADKLVTYDNRLEYCEMVKEQRLNENKLQVAAIRDGLVSVIPSEVLHLLTWQELEMKVCGNPEISVEAMKKSTRYDSSLSEKSQAVKIMWEALEKFSNKDRSRFLRFITGRRRLPCTIFIDSADGESSSKLPTSATCSNTLYLPKYGSVEEAVDRLRYAAYNCVAIDTDMSVYE